MLVLVAVAGLLVGLALAVWSTIRPDQLTDVESWQYCAAWYAEAATAAESAAVDARRPALARRYGDHGLSCHILRAQHERE